MEAPEEGLRLPKEGSACPPRDPNEEDAAACPKDPVPEEPAPKTAPGCADVEPNVGAPPKDGLLPNAGAPPNAGVPPKGALPRRVRNKKVKI